MVDRFWQRKPEVLAERLVPLLVCPPQIPHEFSLGLNSDLYGESPANNCLSTATENIVASFRWKLAKIYCSGLQTIFMVCKIFKITLRTSVKLHCMTHALGRVPYCGPWDGTDMAKCRRGYDRSQANYFVEVNCGMDGNKFSLHPVHAAFRSKPFCSCTSPISCFILSPGSFAISALTLKLLWLEGEILKVCIVPYLHDKGHATKRLSTDVLLFWENAWRNSGTIATILTTLLRVISEFVHHNSEGYDDLLLHFLHTLHHRFFPAIRLHITSAVRTPSLNDLRAIT